MDLATGQDRAHLQYYERNLALNALANPVRSQKSIDRHVW